MYAISLPNILKTNFKQMARIELKVTNCNNILRATTLYAWRHQMCCRSFADVTLHFQCHYIIVRKRFCWRIVQLCLCTEILKLCSWICEYDCQFVIQSSVKYEWVNIGVFFPTFKYYDVMNKSSDRERLVPPFCGDATSCIRQVTFYDFKVKHT